MKDTLEIFVKGGIYNVAAYRELPRPHGSVLAVRDLGTLEDALAEAAKFFECRINESDELSIDQDDAQWLVELAGGDPRREDNDGMHWGYAPSFNEFARAWQKFAPVTKKDAFWRGTGTYGGRRIAEA